MVLADLFQEVLVIRFLSALLMIKLSLRVYQCLSMIMLSLIVTATILINLTIYLKVMMMNLKKLTNFFWFFTDE